MEDHIRYDSDSHVLDLLDQRLLPTQESRVLCQSTADIVTALKDMVVRGAPAIGVAGGFGVYLAAKQIQADNYDDFYAQFKKAKELMLK